MFKSLVYENGAVFEDHDDHCTECTCLVGAAMIQLVYISSLIIGYIRVISGW